MLRALLEDVPGDLPLMLLATCDCEREALDEDAGTATFKLADVEENRPQAKKGQGMNKKQREWRATVKFEDMKKANLFVGF